MPSLETVTAVVADVVAAEFLPLATRGEQPVSWEKIADNAADRGVERADFVEATHRFAVERRTLARRADRLARRASASAPTRH